MLILLIDIRALLFIMLAPEVFRVQAGLAHLSQSVHHNRLILLVGDTVPLILAGQQANSCLLLRQQLVYHAGQEVLALQGIGLGSLLQEGGEACLGLVQVAAGEAPHVHGHDGVIGQVGPGGAVVLGVPGHFFALDDLGPLDDVFQIAFGVGGADTTGHAAVFGNGVLQQIAHHGVLIDVVTVGMGA